MCTGWWYLLGFGVIAMACQPSPDPARVVIVVLDDVGVDKLRSYRPGAERLPPTPHIDGLAQRGVRFENAYAFPTCSPTRAALLTGRYGRRYGLGVRIEANTADALPTREVAIPRMLQQAEEPWPSAFLGKWHLTGHDVAEPLQHPHQHGFETFLGSMLNLNAPSEGDATGYYLWEKVQNGERAITERYATTDTVDDAIRLLGQRTAPRLLVVSFHAVHTPLEAPPEALVTQRLGTSDPDLYDLTLEAMDTEIGRLLGDIEAHHPQTTVFLLGDNGTTSIGMRASQDPQRSKGTVYEGGVRVPFVVSGPAVQRAGQVSEALVHVVDVFPTVAALAGLDPTTLHDDSGKPLVLDGISLLPWLADPAAPSGRDILFSETFRPNGPPPWDVRQTVRTLTHKLIRTPTGDELYALEARLHEGEDLLDGEPTEAQRATAEALGAQLDAVLASTPYRDPSL